MSEIFEKRKKLAQTLLNVITELLNSCNINIDFNTVFDTNTKNRFRGNYENLNNREKQIVCMISHGCGTNYICEALCISKTTFQSYLSRVYDQVFFINNDRNDNYSKRIRLALYYLQAIGKLDESWYVE